MRSPGGMAKFLQTPLATVELAWRGDAVAMKVLQDGSQSRTGRMFIPFNRTARTMVIPFQRSFSRGVHLKNIIGREVVDGAEECPVASVGK